MDLFNIHIAALLRISSKVNDFTFVQFYLKVITSDVKVLYDLLMETEGNEEFPNQLLT